MQLSGVLLLWKRYIFYCFKCLNNTFNVKWKENDKEYYPSNPTFWIQMHKTSKNTKSVNLKIKSRIHKQVKLRLTLTSRKSKTGLGKIRGNKTGFETG